MCVTGLGIPSYSYQALQYLCLHLLDLSVHERGLSVQTGQLLFSLKLGADVKKDQGSLSLMPLVSYSASPRGCLVFLQSLSKRSYRAKLAEIGLGGTCTQALNEGKVAPPSKPDTSVSARVSNSVSP